MITPVTYASENKWIHAIMTEQNCTLIEYEKARRSA